MKWAHLSYQLLTFNLCFPILLDCTWTPLTRGPWCSFVLSSYIISSRIFPSPPVSTKMPPFSHLWLFSDLIRNYTKCCYSSVIMSTSSKCEKQGCMVHILVISYLSRCNLLLHSLLSSSYLFFLKMSWRKKKVYIIYLTWIYVPLFPFLHFGLYFYIKAPQFWSSVTHFVPISNYYSWKINWIFSG